MGGLSKKLKKSSEREKAHNDTEMFAFSDEVEVRKNMENVHEKGGKTRKNYLKRKKLLRGS